MTVTPLNALAIGTAARHALAGAGGGSVLAVFERSLYLAAGNGGLACIGPAALGHGPLNILVDACPPWDRQDIGPGAAYRVAGDRLLIAGAAPIDLANALPWRPTTLPAWSRGDLAAGLAALAGRAAGAAPAEGLGFWVARPLAGKRGFDAACRRAARVGLAALSLAITRQLTGLAFAVDAAAAGLIGLGPGLTPSGDDALAGALIALRALGHPRAADDVADWLLPLAAHGTGRISLAFLQAATQGEGAAALHDMLATLVTPGTPDLEVALAALDAIGHTSGWDGLAGMVCVARALCGTA
ncbi:MAG: DUF2877 domain-containing protein [Alphaproteobacteria bacterium]|nr:DUF2877 domain-containing protein [Alphaproteobacteria bacterium]